MSSEEEFDVDDIILILDSLVKTSSQSELARTLGVSRQHVSDVMRGVRQPTARLLDVIGYERIVKRVVTYRPKSPSSVIP